MANDELNAWVVEHCNRVRLPDGTFGPWKTEGLSPDDMVDGYQEHLGFVRKRASEKMKE